ncbi:BMP family lipoprotein [Ectobacillus antri]|uniref:BMP family lipoprotein n=1 Tax=Ectobacillus antri TaxID=2486280 RepID=UPI003F6D9E1C
MGILKKKSLIVAMCTVTLFGCSETRVTKQEQKQEQKPSIGIMLSDVGLGDQSFSDSAFKGLERARDELGVAFDYREISDTKSYEAGLEELVKEDHELVVGLGFVMQEPIEKVAKKNPKQQFLLVDAVSELPNVHSVTFKENEGSYLIGILAGMKTKTNKVGFIGGMDVPLINKFLAGFKQGVMSVNPNAEITVAYANNFGDDTVGKSIANNMIDSGVDFIYPAAGLTGVGSIQAAQERNVYAFGVDSDQFYIAERAVVSSMLKKIDVAIYEVAKQLEHDGKVSKKNLEFGIQEKGVGIAPVRILPLTETEQTALQNATKDIASGTKQVDEK